MKGKENRKKSVIAKIAEMGDVTPSRRNVMHGIRRRRNRNEIPDTSINKDHLKKYKPKDHPIKALRDSRPLKPSKSFGYLNEYYGGNMDMLGGKRQLRTFFYKEENVFSSVVEPTIVDGAYEFELEGGLIFVINMTENTTFTIPPLSDSQSITFTVIMTGDFSPTITDGTKYGDNYDGTIRNQILFNCFKNPSEAQVNEFYITNLS